jgi:hypothetical protein
MALVRFSDLWEDFWTYRPAGLEQLAGTFNWVRFVSLRKVRFGWFCKTSFGIKYIHFPTDL